MKRGIKCWIRADARSAYCQKLVIYLGKADADAGKNGSFFDVVWDLVEMLQGKYYCIYFDNAYTSVPLLKYCYAKGLYCAGTIRQNRKFLAKEIKNPGKLQRGESKTVQSARLSNLSLTVWQDTKEVGSHRHCQTHGQ